MVLLLKAILLSCVILVVAGLVVLLALKRFFRRLAGELHQALAVEPSSPPGTAEAPTLTPATITVQGTTAPGWGADTPQARDVAQLRQAGMRSLGGMAVPEMPGLRMEVLVHDADQYYGIVYEHPKAGDWTDLVAYEEGDTALTVSSASHSGKLESMPGRRKKPAPGAEAAKLVQIMAGERDASVRKSPPGTLEECCQRFKAAYDTETAWRAAKGGPSEAEIRAVSGGQHSDEAIAETKRRMEAKASAQLTELCLNQFASDRGCSGEAWASLRERLVVVHANMSTTEAATLFAAAAGCAPEWSAETAQPGALSLPARDCFAALARGDHGTRRLSLAGSVSTPVGADIYE